MLHAVNLGQEDFEVRIGDRHTAVPSGQYNVVLEKIEKSKFSGKRDTFAFTFRIVEGDFDGAIVRGFVNAHYKNFSEHTKLYRWLRAAGQEELEKGETVKLDVFRNKVLRTQIELKTSRLTKNSFGNVVEILGVIREF